MLVYTIHYVAKCLIQYISTRNVESYPKGPKQQKKDQLGPPSQDHKKCHCPNKILKMKATYTMILRPYLFCFEELINKECGIN